MVKLSDSFYFNFLKKGGIIIAILGIIIGIFVLNYAFHWIKGISQVSEVSTKTCTDSTSCIEHCGECVSIKDSRICQAKGIKCSCINSTCQKAA
ncbi:MAG: hypothetical protein PHC66_04350 [Candidatus Nanoarchaeia archaeon]|nr:hypothetical protein [Candidatus Nanoarchaeia archaeon]MDD5239450.1 hypothetical protein [Candidatus Nanoarchaeia archaeon]